MSTHESMTESTTMGWDFDTYESVSMGQCESALRAPKLPTVPSDEYMAKRVAEWDREDDVERERRMAFTHKHTCGTYRPRGRR